jgi:hypothetical protein
MLGYIFFFITTFFYIGLAIFTASKHNMAGDNAMGYGLALFFWGISFALSSLLLTIILLSKNGFVWLSEGVSLRTTLVLLCCLLVALTTFFCAVFKQEWPNDTMYPQFLHWLAVAHGYLWIPLLWLVVCFLSLNTDWQSTLSPGIFKFPFWVGLGISTVFSGGLLVGYVRDSVQTYEAKVASQNEQEERWHQEKLNQIAAHQPGDPIINLLSFTNRYQPEDIRQATLTKIKYYPDWEAQLLELLKNKKAYREVYYFLDGNRVEHPQQFAGPLNESIEWLSAAIKADIEDSNNLQHWSFDMYGIDKLLRAIDEQFLDKDVDYYPTVVKLKQALNTTPPEQFKGVHFTATDVVDEWLKKHKY